MAVTFNPHLDTPATRWLPERPQVRQGEDVEEKKRGRQGGEMGTMRVVVRELLAWSRHLRTVWPHRQTKGKKLGNVEGMWMKECIYRFVLGQIATLTEFSSFCQA